MAAIEEFKLGDLGGVIIGTIVEGTSRTAVNIATATSLKFYFRTPKGDVIEKSGSLNTTGTDGKMKYTVEDDFLKIALRDRLVGEWSYQCKCTIGTWTGTSDTGNFRVTDVLRKT